MNDTERLLAALVGHSALFILHSAVSLYLASTSDSHIRFGLDTLPAPAGWYTRSLLTSTDANSKVVEVASFSPPSAGRTTARSRRRKFMSCR